MSDRTPTEARWSTIAPMPISAPNQTDAAGSTTTPRIADDAFIATPSSSISVAMTKSFTVR